MIATRTWRHQLLWYYDINCTETVAALCCVESRRSLRWLIVYVQEKMKSRLKILRWLALLTLFPGVVAVVTGIAIGFKISVLTLWLAAALVFLGCLWISIPIRFLKKPSASVASDILTVWTLYLFGAVYAALQKYFPSRVAISDHNAEIAKMLISLLVAWAIFRLLRKRLVDDAFAPDKANKADA